MYKFWIKNGRLFLQWRQLSFKLEFWSIFIGYYLDLFKVGAHTFLFVCLLLLRFTEQCNAVLAHFWLIASFEGSRGTILIFLLMQQLQCWLWLFIVYIDSALGLKLIIILVHSSTQMSTISMNESSCIRFKTPGGVNENGWVCTKTKWYEIILKKEGYWAKKEDARIDCWPQGLKSH